MQTLLVEAWQQQGGEELTSREETVTDTHMERGWNYQSFAWAHTDVYILHWLNALQHFARNMKRAKWNWRFTFKLQQTAKQLSLVYQKKKKTIWKCNIVFWADQISHSRTEQRIQRGRSESAMGSHINHNNDIIEMIFQRKNRDVGVF